MRQNKGYTLIEVVLALGLAVIVLGLVGMGIHVQLAVAAKSRDQVEEAQLARGLLQRIADDLRNAVPFIPPPSSTSSSASSDSGAPDPSTSSGTSDSINTTPISGGVYGTTQAIQIETARRPRASFASLQQIVNDPTQPARLSDIRVVSYSLGAPSNVDMSQELPSSTSGTGGLYRHDQDRAEFFYGSQNGQPDDADPATELLAPEVVDFQLSYYGDTSSSGTSSSAASDSSASSDDTSSSDTSTDGTTPDEQWDSTQEGHLPSAVRISISLRRESPKSLLSLLDTEKRPPVVYSLLVFLPNQKVDAASQAKEQATKPPKSSAFVSITPGGTGGNAFGGGRGGRGFGAGKPGGEKGGGEKGGGEKGRGERGRGEKGRGEEGRGEEGRGEKGRGEKGRGETGRGETGRGETGRGETGRGEKGRGEKGGERGRGEQGDNGEAGRGRAGGRGEGSQGGRPAQGAPSQGAPSRGGTPAAGSPGAGRAGR